MTHRARTEDSRDDFETPPEVFEKLAARAGGFDLDVFASDANHLAPHWFIEDMDALGARRLEWDGGILGRRAFSNPPYARADEALEAASEQRIEVYSLVPAATATAHWFRNVWGLADEEHGASEVWFVSPRINFLIDGKRPLDKNGRESSGNHDSAVVIHRPIRRGPPAVAVWDWKRDVLTYLPGGIR